MALIDPSILLQAQTPNYVGSLLQGASAVGNIQQMQQQKAQYARKQAAQQAFAKAAQGEDITKPDGMRNAIGKFAQAGFPDEASAVLEAHKDMFATKAKTFLPIDAANGKYRFNTENGDYEKMMTVDENGNATPIMPTERKANFAKTADKWQGTKWVKDSATGSMVLVDAEGKDKGGNPIQVWTAPAKSTGQGLRATASRANNLSGQSAKDATPYKSGMDAINQAESSYADYSKNPGNTAARIQQQDILDQFVRVASNKSTTEAQYKFASDHFPGIDNYAKMIGNKIMVAAPMPADYINEMMRIMRQTMINKGSTLKNLNAQITDRANKMDGVDPSSIINYSNNQLTQDSTSFANRMKPQAPATGPVAEPKSRAEFDALPSGSTWKDSRGGIHRKK